MKVHDADHCTTVSPLPETDQSLPTPATWVQHDDMVTFVGVDSVDADKQRSLPRTGLTYISLSEAIVAIFATATVRKVTDLKR